MNTNSIVLIVDDDPVGRESVGLLLEPLELTLLFAGDGQTALQKAFQTPPDLILLDVMMPGMDGFAVCRHLRANPKTAAIPIIILTALEDRESRLRGIEAGADDFISKPFDGMELQARVRTITRLNRYRRLVAEQAKFEYVVEQANTGYLLLNEAGEITFANPQARIYLNLPERGSLPQKQKFRELATAVYHVEPVELWQNWPPPPGAILYLVRPETEQTAAFWLKVTLLNNLPPGPEAVQMISLVDVTEQMQVQRNMWAFHSAVNHKLRTPTTFITGAMEMLKNDLGDEEKQALLKLFSKGIYRLQQALEDVLQYVDMPAGSGRAPSFRLADFPALVSRIGADLAISAVTVELSDPAQSLPLPLTPLAMERIVWELMENAKKFHPQHAPVVTWQVTAVDENQLRLQITDNGRTLPPDQLARIWTPYYQVEKQFTGQIEGMGLGLPLVANLVWSAGGRCRAANRDDGPGLCVALYLPARPLR